MAGVEQQNLLNLEYSIADPRFRFNDEELSTHTGIEQVNFFGIVLHWVYAGVPKIEIEVRMYCTFGCSILS
jgi:hypothetical protein